MDLRRVTGSDARTRPGRRLVLRGAVATLGAALLGPLPAVARVPIRIASTGQHGPFSYYDAAGRRTGIIIDGLELIAGPADLALEFHDLPWARAQQMIRAGELDAFCTEATAERQRYAAFAPTPLVEEPSGFLHRAGDPRIPRIASVAELASLRVGGSLGNGWLREIMAGGRIEWVPDLDNLVGMVDAGRLDLGVIGEYEAKFLLRGTDAASRLVFTPAPFLGTAHYCFGLRRSFADAEAIVARVEDAIAAAVRSGALQAIFARYA
jgi:polar amino acid transport system substrate-binding protein